ncbi:MAG: peptidylprolyl isomerase [Proteobacteria bacterium]|nr:MAG: peptidylprolyl isomerase [Pseudomonadota bacterium]
MSIKKKLVVAGISVGLGLSVSQAVFAEAKPQAKEAPAVEVKKAVVVAVVNGKAITQDALNKYLSVVQRSAAPKKNDPRAALEDLIATELALQEAAKTDILSRDEVKQSIEDFTRNVLLSTWTKEKVESFEVSDEQLQKTYDERIKKDADNEYKARHILLKTEDDAKAVIKELADGAKFEEVAKKKSTGPSASNGGDLGWFKSKTMVKPFADAVKAMKKGKVSAAPVKTQFGWHVIKLEDTRPAKLPTLEVVKPQLRRMLAQQMMMDYMEKMKESADIKIMLTGEKEEAKPAKKDDAAKAPKKAE